MLVGVISLFPGMFNAITNYGITGKAVKKGLLHINFWNPREFSDKLNRSVDDRPYGGGPGMLMMAKPIRNAINAAKNKIGKEVKVIYLSPQGSKFNQKNVIEFSINNPRLILVCGRYKGIDERLIITEIDEEWSIGDYVLSGGELAAMVVIDSISRYIVGITNHKESVKSDSFSRGLLDCPYYTRPLVSVGMQVPLVLLSGNHDKIRRWRLKQSLGRTWIRRPDLLQELSLTTEQKMLLTEFQYDYLSL